MTSEEKMWETYDAFNQLLTDICEDSVMDPTDKWFLLLLIHRRMRSYATPSDDTPDDVRRFIIRVDRIIALHEAREGQVN